MDNQFVLILGGFAAITTLQMFIDTLVVSKVMDDPVNGKILSTLCAYVVASMFYLYLTNSFVGLLLNLPGGLLVGWLQYRRGMAIRATMTDRNGGERFE